MSPDVSRMLEEIVFLEVADASQVGMNPGRYLAAARTVREIVERDLGGLTMEDFASTLPVLQTTAENIFFDAHGCFADLDGSGSAQRAETAANRLLHTLRGGRSA